MSTKVRYHLSKNIYDVVDIDSLNKEKWNSVSCNDINIYIMMGFTFCVNSIYIAKNNRHSSLSDSLMSNNVMFIPLTLSVL